MRIEHGRGWSVWAMLFLLGGCMDLFHFDKPVWRECGDPGVDCSEAEGGTGGMGSTASSVGSGGNGTASSGSGGGSSGSTGSSSSSTGSSASSSSSSAGGTSSSSSSGGGICSPGMVESCYSGPPQTAGIGICHAGTRTCLPTGLGFGPCAGEELPRTEVCDGLDNDCNGVVDNGDPGGGANCTTGNLGICSMGTAHCNAGSIVCDQNAQPVAESCDGLDNDCNGLVDENNPGVGMSCNTGLMGVCVSGTVTACTGGQPVCQQNMQASVEQCATSTDENCDGLSNCVGNHIASKRCGGALSQAGQSIAGDSALNIIVAGNFQGSMVCDGPVLQSAGGTDIFLAKFDQQFNVVWSKRFGDIADQVVMRLAVDSMDNIIVAGFFGGTVNFGGTNLQSAGGTDIFVAKFDPNGVHLWSKRAGDAGEQAARGIAVDTQGNVIIVGTNSTHLATIDFGCGPTSASNGEDFFLAKLDSLGTCLWSMNASAPNNQFANDVSADSIGNVFITGHYTSTFTIGGNTLNNMGASDVFVSKFNASGMHIWSKGFGSTTSDNGQNVACDSLGNALISGGYDGPITIGAQTLPNAGFTDVFVAKLDPDGNPLWGRSISGTNDQYSQDLVIDAADNVLLTGVSYGALDFGLGDVATCVGNPDVMAGKFEKNGVPLWGKCWGDGYSQSGSGISADKLGNVLLTGNFAGTIDFGGGPLSASPANNVEVFLAKLTP